jgi:thioredoxin reductase (NADPH)
MSYIRCFTSSRWAIIKLYPKKPIYDIPGFPEVLAGDLVSNLMEQIKQFEPGFTLGERAETIDKQGSFIVTSNEGTQFHSKVVAIAGGLGSFEPRKPLIDGINFYEQRNKILYQRSRRVQR